ncbi:MAG: SpoIIE family protein phosphatase [Vicinamibacteria bacterium]|nr:SpoIIE family protein phosphatase [Vicinamibacteria bacterium]
MSAAFALEPVRPFRVLVADDQLDVQIALRLLLKSHGCELATASDPAEILARLRHEEFDVVLMDLNYTRDTTSGREGLETLARVRELVPGLPVVVMTAWGTLEIAVEAMRRGADDFVLKPWDNALLVDRVTQHARRRLQSEAEARRREADRRDLELARRVQASLFPGARPVSASLDYAGECLEAGAVGGDFYDFLDLGPERMGLVLADVAGKGVSAALLMASLQAFVRSRCSSVAGPDLGLRLQEVNRLFFTSTPAERYATLFIAVWDGSTRALWYANCGHTPPLLRRRSGHYETLSPTSTVLGLFEEWEPDVRHVALEPGDLLVAVSDGVTEAARPDGEEFGLAGLRAVMEGLATMPATAVPSAVVAATLGHVGSAAQDDLTTLVARVR